MNGLLDFLNDDSTGRSEARLALASGLLNGRGSGISRLATGMQGYNQALALAKREEDLRKAREQELQMRALQMEEAKRAQEAAALAAQQRARDQGLMRNLIDAPVEQRMGRDEAGPPAMIPTQGLDPRRFLSQGGSFDGLPTAMALNQALQPPKPAAPIVSKPGDIARDPSTGQMVWQNPAAPKEQAPTNLARLIAERDALPPGHPNRRLYDQEIAKQTTHAPGVNVSYGAPVAGIGPDNQPVFFQPGKDGGPPAIVPGVRPPGAVADQKKEAEAKVNTAQTAQRVSNTITQMLAHPGLDTALGLSGQIDPRNRIWGTDAQGAKALIEQAQGQAFLQAFESLKGGGQITQIEGEKATAAIARLQRSQKPSDFRAAAQELQDIANTAYKRAAGKEIPSSGGTQKVITSDAEYDALPSGATFVGPDGKTRRKP